MVGHTLVDTLTARASTSPCVLHVMQARPAAAVVCGFGIWGNAGCGLVDGAERGEQGRLSGFASVLFESTPSGILGLGAINRLASAVVSLPERLGLSHLVHRMGAVDMARGTTMRRQSSRPSHLLRYLQDHTAATTSLCMLS